MIKQLRRSKLLRFISLFLIVNILLECVAPMAAYALTSGPSSPEFSSFEPVATTDMVNLFSGDFTYNLPVLEIPGPDGAGYALSLSYHSGASSEEESSWVGYGWSVNPGSINRNMRGFPDDYKDVSVKQYNKSPVNWSSSITLNAGMEIFSKKLFNKDKGNSSSSSSTKDSLGITPTFSMSSSLRFNNYQGFARYQGYGIGVKGLGSVDINSSAQGITYAANVNIPNKLFKATESKKTIENGLVSRFNNERKKHTRSQVQKGIGSTYGIFSYSQMIRPTAVPRSNSVSYNWTKGISGNLAPAVGANAGASGNLTITKPNATESLTANGYMYNTSTGDNKKLSDYYVEKGNPFSKRDLYLGVPFNNADNFMVSGEGLGGGFRFFPKRTGHFYPDLATNKTKILQSGFELNIGASIGVGLSFGVGFDKSIIKDWSNNGNTTSYRFAGEPSGVFRFNNDMGGSISYANADVQSAGINRISPVPGAKMFEPEISSDVRTALDDSTSTSSSYITYHTQSDISANPAIRFNKGSNPGTANTKNTSGVAEMAIFNTDGTQYVYGLPVYNQNETNLHVDVTQSEKPADRYLAHKNLYLKKDAQSNYDLNTDKHNTAIGEIRSTPYTSAYLLTQLFTTDYVDVNDNGADNADFGGWTQFHYHQSYGKNGDSLYRWRLPYTGLLYNQNQISDGQDDAGTLSSGEKEIYYLKAIETKTHVAFFVTNRSTATRWSELITKLNLNGQINTEVLKGSGKDRKDALGARALEADNDPAARNAANKGTQQLEYLEKIVLFAKARPDKPLKTTHFQYDYSLVGNLPNNVSGTYPTNKSKNAGGSGKLTLKKVWFEYEGVVNSKISPYEFTYKYKDVSAFPDYVRNLYPEETAVGSRYSDYAQNPDYMPHLLDPWGNIQIYGKERKKHMIPWIYQGPLPAENTSHGWRNEIVSAQGGTTTNTSSIYPDFDPAAWQLKQIKLPSGGEILVEYEQKDYAYVQDRAPMAMAGLLESSEPMSSFKKYGSAPEYTINCRDLGLDPQSEEYEADLAEQIQKIKDYFQKEKIYFKYLYAMSLRNGSPSLDNCLSEYITGYAVADKVEAATISVNGKSEKHIKLTLKGENSSDGERTAVPRQACYEYYTTQRLGKWKGSACESDMDQKYGDLVTSKADQLLNFNLIAKMEVMTTLMVAMIGNFNNVDYLTPSKGEVGAALNNSLSYLKLPLIKAKRGGGIRVKRLLMYDPGIESGDAALYGQEYIYQDFKKVNGQWKAISSGVATNEPTDSREENPLIGFMPRKGQSWYSRITAGEDKEQTEGPIGESLLPGPSIGHSRIVVRNIHKGNTNTGFTVYDYHTVKDYPYDKLYTGGSEYEFGSNAQGVEATSINERKDYMFLPAGFFYYEVNKVWAVQGYRFLINNMHGQMKRTATYPGNYDPTSPEFFQLIANEQILPIAGQQYTYYQPGERVKMLHPDGTYTMEVPGKEMDLNMEMKAVLQQTMDLGVDIDINIPLTIQPLVVSAFLNFAYHNKGISTHVTSKVIRYPVIVKSVTAYQDGVKAVTDNLAFNPHTGQAALTHTYDSFHGLQANGKKLDGSIYSLSLPASWYYPEMGRKSENAAFQNDLSAMTGTVVSYGKDGNPLNGTTGTWHIPMQGVINASAQTFRKGWFPENGDATYEAIATEYSAIADAKVREKLNATWRPQSAYVYREDILSAHREGGRVYNSGPLTDFQPFAAWTTTGTVPDQSKWILGSEVLHYSPHGSAIEERNALDIYSTARFGYGGMLPATVASNARYGAIRFQDYEYGQFAGTTTEFAHSGYKSLRVESSSINLLSGLTADPASFPKGAWLKWWAKAEQDSTLSSHTIQIGTAAITPETVARTGEWTLYRAYIPAASLPAGNFSIVLNSNATSVNRLYVDDVRLQPKEAQATCYVYDVKTLRLVTQFDDQHFGLFYQYNDEGKLVRKQIETERGLKTVQETQYNTPKRPRQ